MLVLIGLIWLVIALVTGERAKQHDLSQWGGILFGLLLGPLGLAIVLLIRPLHHGA